MKYIDPLLCKIIGEQLNSFQFNGRVGFVGFGEPLLHPNLVDAIANIRQTCPTTKWIEVNTNGDILTRELAIELSTAGCTDIGISMYDGDKSKFFNEMLDNTGLNVILRHHYTGPDNELKIINRIDIIKNEKFLNIQRPCYLPFYKMFIDWNGDYILCDQDWGKVSRQHNLLDINIADFWQTKLANYRENLAKGNRNLNPCNKCDINGTLHGIESFNKFLEYYDESI